MDVFTPQITPAEEQEISAFMARLAATPAPVTPALQAHRSIWWKAQLLRRWDDQRRAAAPLNVMEPFQIVASLVATALVFMWAMPSLVRAFAMVVGNLVG